MDSRAGDFNLDWVVHLPEIPHKRDPSYYLPQNGIWTNLQQILHKETEEELEIANIRKAMKIYCTETWRFGDSEWLFEDEPPVGLDINPDSWSEVRTLLRKIKHKEAMSDYGLFWNGGDVGRTQLHRAQNIRAVFSESKLRLRSSFKSTTFRSTTVKRIKNVNYGSAHVMIYILTEDERLDKKASCGLEFQEVKGRQIRDISSKELKHKYNDHLMTTILEVNIVADVKRLDCGLLCTIYELPITVLCPLSHFDDNSNQAKLLNCIKEGKEESICKVRTERKTSENSWIGVKVYTKDTTRLPENRSRAAVEQQTNIHRYRHNTYDNHRGLHNKNSQIHIGTFTAPTGNCLVRSDVEDSRPVIHDTMGNWPPDTPKSAQSNHEYCPLPGTNKKTISCGKFTTSTKGMEKIMLQTSPEEYMSTVLSKNGIKPSVSEISLEDLIDDIIKEDLKQNQLQDNRVIRSTKSHIYSERRNEEFETRTKEDAIDTVLALDMFTWNANIKKETLQTTDRFEETLCSSSLRAGVPETTNDYLQTIHKKPIDSGMATGQSGYAHYSLLLKSAMGTLSANSVKSDVDSIEYANYEIGHNRKQSPSVTTESCPTIKTNSFQNDLNATKSKSVIRRRQNIFRNLLKRISNFRVRIKALNCCSKLF